MTGASLIDDPFFLAVNKTHQLNLMLTYNTGSQYNDTNNSTGSSSKTTVATVSTGMVTGKSAGTATITGTSQSELLQEGYICLGNDSCPAAVFVETDSGLVQIPTASRITKELGSHVANSSNGVGSGTQPGWYRQVQKIVTDQTGTDIAFALQVLNETVTITTPNQLGITGSTLVPLLPTSTVISMTRFSYVVRTAQAVA